MALRLQTLIDCCGISALVAVVLLVVRHGDSAWGPAADCLRPRGAVSRWPPSDRPRLASLETYRRHRERRDLSFFFSAGALERYRPHFAAWTVKHAAGCRR